MKEKVTAIIVAAGRGERMGIPGGKTYLPIGGEPILKRTLRAFEESAADSIVLVAAPDGVDRARESALAWGISKLSAVVPGGAERSLSVAAGLRAAEDADIVLIHDGARPFVTADIIDRTVRGAREFGACCAAVKARDTVKIADADGFVQSTPARESVWQMQTPQAFRGPVIRGAYAAMLGEMAGNAGDGKPESSGDASLCGEAVFTIAGTGAAGDIGAARAMTDDAMVVEVYGNCRVRLVEGSYDNIKITTPEDIPVAEAILARRSGGGQQP